MRTLILALVLVPIWVGPALAQENRKPARTSPAARTGAAVERNPAVEALERRLAALEGSLRRERPEVPLDVQIQTLADRISALEGRVSALEQGNGAARLEAVETATEELAGQLASLLAVIEVTGAGVTINTAGKLSLQGSDLAIAAGKVTVGAPLVEFQGILKAVTVEAQTMVADTYTPGAGNVW